MCIHVRTCRWQVCRVADLWAVVSWCHSQPTRKQERWQAPCRYRGQYRGLWWYRVAVEHRRWWTAGTARSQGCYSSACRRLISSNCRRSADLYNNCVGLLCTNVIVVISRDIQKCFRKLHDAYRRSIICYDFHSLHEKSSEETIVF